MSLPVEDAACLFCNNTHGTVVARGRDYEYATSPEYFDFVRCRACGLIFLQPRPAAAAMSIIYPQNYYAYNEESGERPFVKSFRDRVERAKVRRYQALLGRDDANVVDIGCGDGRLLEILQRFGPPDWHLAGIEIGEAAARRTVAKGFEVRSGDFEFLELLDWVNHFDLALMHHVIEHTRQPRAAIRKVASLLRRGGIVSIETPDTRGWDFQLFQKRYWGGYHIPRHFYLFDSHTLATLLQQEGFEVIAVRSILSPAFWVHSVHNWLADQSWGTRLAPYLHPQNVFAIGVATAIEILQQVTRRQSSNLQVLARRL